MLCIIAIFQLSLGRFRSCQLMGKMVMCAVEQKRHLNIDIPDLVAASMLQRMHDRVRLRRRRGRKVTSFPSPLSFPFPFLFLIVILVLHPSFSSCSFSYDPASSSFSTSSSPSSSFFSSSSSSSTSYSISPSSLF